MNNKPYFPSLKTLLSLFVDCELASWQGTNFPLTGALHHYSSLQMGWVAGPDILEPPELGLWPRTPVISSESPQLLLNVDTFILLSSFPQEIPEFIWKVQRTPAGSGDLRQGKEEVTSAGHWSSAPQGTAKPHIMPLRGEGARLVYKLGNH
jgi:hypothetical protein